MLKLFQRLGLIPRRCTWEITLACNLRCGHCGSRAGRARPDELTTAQALAVVDDLATLGCRHVTLAGGEPTLRADWPILMARLRKQGVRASLITNGLTWTTALAQQARDAGIHRLGISIDGLERSHDCVRRLEGGFERVLAAIDITREAGIEMVAVTHFTQRNIDELERLHALLGEHGVAIWQVQLGVPAGNMADEHDVIITDAQLLELVPRIAALNRAGVRPTVMAADNIGYYGPYEQDIRASRARVDFWVGCQAGLSLLGLESHGDVKGCLSLPSSLNGRTDFVEGNVRERSLIDIWHDPDTFAYNRRFRVEHLKGDCQGCEYGEICRGGCTWTSASHHGHPHQFPHCYHALEKRAAKHAPPPEPSL